MAHPVGLGHGDGRDPLGAEAVDDRAVDLQAARGLHVDVDVGQHGPPLGQEPLHQQPVLDGVGVRDAQQVVDERAGARAAGGDPDAHLPDVVHDLGDGEEVRGEAVVVDDVQLVVQSAPSSARWPPVVAAQHHARRRSAERSTALRRCGGPAPTRPRLGEVDAADAEVVLGVDQALAGGRLGLLEQPVRGVAPVTRRPRRSARRRPAMRRRRP